MAKSHRTRSIRVTITEQHDEELINLSEQRAELMKDYADTLRRAGASNTNRSKLNAARAKARKALRQLLKKNAADIVVRVMTITSHLREIP